MQCNAVQCSAASEMSVSTTNFGFSSKCFEVFSVIFFISQKFGFEFELVDDTYNANPDSVRAAIDVLAGLPGPRLLVLGDMGEVGSNGPQFHAEAGAYARAVGIETLFTLGELSKVASEAFEITGTGGHWQTMEALQKGVVEVLPQYRSVLVKGSRFMKMEKIVEAVMAVGQGAHTHHTVVSSKSARASMEAPCS